VKVLRALDLRLEMQEAPVGGAGYDAARDPLPEATLDLARRADAVLFGAVGGPRYDALERAERPEQALLRLRKELGLLANLRPAVVYPELAGASTVKADVVSGLDLLIVRELTGDIYFGEPRGIRELPGGAREGFDTMRYSEPEIRRIAEVAFRAAAKRRNKLCSLDADNKGLYEPIHGSAPDIAGRNVANPLATILSAAMMLRYSLDLEPQAARVEAAVKKALARGLRTADIHRPGTTRVGTGEMG